ncbi:uncharacterized protein TNCV_4658951 [Trichonephila clavipes]|nr:uncharacterized protein TNCV_4658951 [Trichonephila clavipes]
MVWRAISYHRRNTLVVIPITLSANMYVSLVVQLIVLPFVNSSQRGFYQQNNPCPHTTVVTKRALQSVGMLPWPVRPPLLARMGYRC